MFPMLKLKEQSSLMRMFFPIFTRASGNGEKMPEVLPKNFIQREEGSIYDLRVQLKKLQESLSSLIRELSEDPLKPNDLKAIIHRI